MSANEPILRRRVLIRGRVQGVWYRGAMQEQADALAVAGWVRNLPDGRVEAVVEGTAEAVEKILAWCAKGPPAAQVEEVTVQHEAVEDLRGFRITH